MKQMISELKTQVEKLGALETINKTVESINLQVGGKSRVSEISSSLPLERVIEMINTELDLEPENLGLKSFDEFENLFELFAIFFYSRLHLEGALGCSKIVESGARLGIESSECFRICDSYFCWLYFPTRFLRLAILLQEHRSLKSLSRAMHAGYYEGQADMDGGEKRFPEGTLNMYIYLLGTKSFDGCDECDAPYSEKDYFWCECLSEFELAYRVKSGDGTAAFTLGERAMADNQLEIAKKFFSVGRELGCNRSNEILLEGIS